MATDENIYMCMHVGMYVWCMCDVYLFILYSHTHAEFMK